MAKQRVEIRREMKRILANLDPRWMRAASNEIASRLSRLLDEGGIGVDPDQVLAWATYVPGAPDLAAFISEQLAQREVFLGRYSSDGELLFLKVDVGETPSLPGAANRSGLAFNADTAQAALLLVPGLAFDRFGGRLGRGDDFYNRFCNQMGAKRIIKIGVGWSFQVLPHLPTEGDDIVVDWLCTEEETIRFSDTFEQML